VNATIPEKSKQRGVSYALTDDGIELPVIDLTHPAFAVAPSPAELAELGAQFVRESERRARLPATIQRVLLRIVLRRSVLGRALMAAEGSFLDGMSTYLMKLGPDNLGSGYAVTVDRRIAASLPALSMRMRLRDVSRMLADGLAPALAAAPGRPCHLLNIAGGPSADTLNALILLHRERAEVLAGRELRIHVLDVDEAGPAFGARALAALRTEGAPLHGLAIEMRHVRYDWGAASRLREVLGALGEEAVMAVASEGGLFDYGSDEAVVENLGALAEGSPASAVVVGSVTRADGPLARAHASSVATRPRTLEAFSALARRAGWAVAKSTEGPPHRLVTLEKG
jgi:hypothetical protein